MPGRVPSQNGSQVRRGTGEHHLSVDQEPFTPDELQSCLVIAVFLSAVGFALLPVVGGCLLPAVGDALLPAAGDVLLPAVGDALIQTTEDKRLRMLSCRSSRIPRNHFGSG